MESSSALPDPHPAATQSRIARYRSLFTVPFLSPMTDGDVRRIAAVLDMTMCMRPKLHASPVSPGVLRLDFYSGLFLLRGGGEDEWRFECRTWGHPASETVHGWHLVAADAARLLDPDVPTPARLEEP